jgi:hypothetical protein
MSIRISGLAAVLLCAVSPALAFDFTDGFNGGSIDAARWTVSTGGGNTIVLDTANHRIVQTQSGQDGGSGLLFDRIPVTGDFDVRVSYAILTPRPPDHNNGNQERVALCADGIGCVERVSDGYFGNWSAPGGGEVYLSHFIFSGGGIAPWPGIITTDLAGALRLTRTGGSTITASYWSGSAWVELQSAAGPSGQVASFSLSIFNGYHPQDGMQIAFDDFSLSAPSTAAPAVIPSVTTGAVSGVTASSANVAGEATADGGATITARGICWSTSASPVLGANCTASGSGLGTFTGALSGLSAGTAYHARAYATNSAGTGYGLDISFTTSAAPTDGSGGGGGGGGCQTSPGAGLALALLSLVAVLRRGRPRPLFRRA